MSDRPVVQPPGVPVLVPARSLRGLDAPQLADALRPLWEDAGPLVARLLGRPVSSWQELIDLGQAEIAAMDDEERIALLQAHPPIGTPPADLAARSALSHGEQGGAAGVDPGVMARLQELNRTYQERFGFPLVEWVAGRSRAEMIPVIEARLGRPRDRELDAGCAALVAIARDRLGRLEPRPPTMEDP